MERAEEATITGIAAELDRCFVDRFKALILDNEVTVDAFVADPPIPWARLTARDGVYRIGEGYPGALTAAEAAREELNWDRVSEAALREALESLDETVDIVVLGNNAGQGLPLAAAMPVSLRAARGIVTYGESLPERSSYEILGFRQFCPRRDLVAYLAGAAEAAGRPLALGFINTIQHDERNYHAPWRGRGTGEDGRG